MIATPDDRLGDARVDVSDGGRDALAAEPGVVAIA
jgi:hypothetical protein